ncbi:MAG TPA: hypothetical protein VL307_02460 [Chitinophagaceae bacterium]|nr:hypothetical protein [Chitinophagaceae bacterium]
MKNKWRVKAPIILLWLAAGFLFVAFYVLFTGWVAENDLQPVSGRVSSANTSIKWVFTKSRDRTRTNKSHRSQLFLRLEDRPQTFYLQRNVGMHYIDEAYETMLREIKSADSVCVWVEEKEIGMPQAAIMQLAVGGKILVQFSPWHNLKNFDFTLLFCAGVFCLSIFFLAKYSPQNARPARKRAKE